MLAASLFVSSDALSDVVDCDDCRLLGTGYYYPWLCVDGFDSGPDAEEAAKAAVAATLLGGAPPHQHTCAWECWVPFLGSLPCFGSNGIDTGSNGFEVSEPVFDEETQTWGACARTTGEGVPVTFDCSPCPFGKATPT